MRTFASLLAALMALTSLPVAAQSEAGEIIEVVGLRAHPSDVDRGNPTLWSTINVDPFQGNVAQASAILSPKTDIRPLERAEAWQMRTRGECFVYQMKPGDETRTTFGLDRTMLAEVGFTGLADVCVIRPDGTAVVFPHDCANIGDALAIVRRRPIIPQAEPDSRQVVVVEEGRTYAADNPTVSNIEFSLPSMGSTVLVIGLGDHRHTDDCPPDHHEE